MLRRQCGLLRAPLARRAARARSRLSRHLGARRIGGCAVRSRRKLTRGSAAASAVSSPDDRGTPFDFVLGQGSVIKGWDLGVSGMCPGEMRKLQVRCRCRNAARKRASHRRNANPRAAVTRAAATLRPTAAVGAAAVARCSKALRARRRTALHPHCVSRCLRSYRAQIPSDLGYGANGSPPKIPGGATLIFQARPCCKPRCALATSPAACTGC